MISLVWQAIVSYFGLGKLIASGAIILSVVAAFGGAYLKGRYDCASKYELASRDVAIAELKKQLLDRADEVQYGVDLFDQFQIVEARNDEVEAILSELPVSGPSCIDANWLRGLSELE
jgi:hypothetical protein